MKKSKAQRAAEADLKKFIKLACDPHIELDTLLAARIVTAIGEVRRLNQTEKPIDMFANVKTSFAATVSNSKQKRLL
jgi:hypothetical protein